MTTINHTIAGIILAGGAGARMGTPKALLEYADGTTLLTRQVEILRGADCARVPADQIPIRPSYAHFSSTPKPPPRAPVFQSIRKSYDFRAHN